MNLKFIKPTIKDIESIQKLIEKDVQSGILLARSNDEIAKNIRSYIIVKNSENDELIGNVALQIHTAELGEIRSLFIKDSYRGKKIGKKLVEQINEEAKNLGLKQLLSLTYKKVFFEKLNFYEIPKTEISEHKIWEDCMKCKFYPNCDEVAMLKDI